jgi:hypothetical protein
MESLRRKSLEQLSQLGFQVADNLPVERTIAGGGPQLRPKNEILSRVLAIKALWLWVDLHPQAESEATVLEMLDEAGLRAHLTTQEAEILSLSRKDAVAQHGHLMGWKNENCWPLAWALGFPEAPSVDQGQVSGKLGKHLMLEWLPNNASECRALEADCALRSVSEVQALEDLFYCAHNAVRSAQLGGTTVPEDFDPVNEGGCIHERRHSLTWLLSPGIGWDETDLST